MHQGTPGIRAPGRICTQFRQAYQALPRCSIGAKFSRRRATTPSGRDERKQAMETTRLVARSSRKRPRPPCAASTNEGEDEPKGSRVGWWWSGRHHHRAPMHVSEVSPCFPSSSSSCSSSPSVIISPSIIFPNSLSSRSGKKSLHYHRGGRHTSPYSRRGIGGGGGGAWKAAAAALFVFVIISAVSLPLGACAASATNGGGSSSRSNTKRPTSASRLCSPADSARAYVTTLASSGAGNGKGSKGYTTVSDQVWGARVLAQSLRSAGAKGDIVVLVPTDRATAANVDSLRRDGLTIEFVPRGLLSAGGETASEDVMTKIFLWSLTSYDRVVYLDPRSLIQKNPDALFACEGFCAAGAVVSYPPLLPPGGSNGRASPPPEGGGGGAIAPSADDDDEASALPVPARPSWQPSTSVMVLEPSIAVHISMLDELAKTPSVGSLDAKAFISSFLGAAGDRCTHFDDLDAGLGGGRRAGHGGSGSGWVEGNNVFGGSGGGGGGGGVGNDGFGSGLGRGGGGGLLEDALTPDVLINGAHVPRCSSGRQRTSARVCQRLPYTYAAPSTDFHGKGNGGKWKHCVSCAQTTDPHIIHFADEDTPWKRLAYLNKPLFWKWNQYREQLEYPYGNFFAPWLLFFIPCVVLACARVYYKAAGGGMARSCNGDDSNSSSSGGRLNVDVCGGGGSGLGSGGASVGTGESPSKRRAPWFLRTKHEQRQVAILPACGLVAAYDGGAVGVSLEAAGGRYCRGPSPSSSGGAAVTSDGTSSSALSLPVGGACYVLSALVAGLGLVWFRAARRLAVEVDDVSWHPVISVAVYNAWLCCGLVLGLYVADYLYYAVMTRGRTLLRDLLAVTVFVSGVCLLHSWDGGDGGSGAWAGAIGVGVIALGFGHGRRAGAAHHLSGRGQFRCITASCVVGTLVSLAMCYSGAEAAHQVAGHRSVAAVAGTFQMIFTALVYASVIGGARLRADMDGAGSTMGRSCSTASFAGDALIAVVSPGKLSEGGVTVALSATTVQQARACAGWSAALVLAAKKAVTFARATLWRRRHMTACLVVLVLWKVTSGCLPTTPGRRFEKYGPSCLGGEAGFVEAGVMRLSRVCGAEQALRPVATGAYFEAFRQDKVCFEVASGGFLTVRRFHVAEACTPENQFVFQQVDPSQSQSTGGRSSARPTDDEKYCVYNPTSGFYLSAQNKPRAQCGDKEHWRVKRAPRAPGLSRGAGAGALSAEDEKSTLSMLTHPDFLSRGPLHTLYGYLLAATALLIARAVFARLASSRSIAASSRGGAGGVDGGYSRQRSGGLGARQRSRGRQHSRAHNKSNNNSGDISSFGDPGYAGDAEAGGVGYGIGSRVMRLQPFGAATGTELRSPSESPVGGAKRGYPGWGADEMVAGSRKMALTREERTVSWSKRFGDRSKDGSMTTTSSAATAATAAAAAAAGARATRDGNLSKLFCALCLACDATLLAGLWCLVPAHFAQALSALTHDHHSAIDHGLGVDSNASGNNNNEWSRHLEGGSGPVAVRLHGVEESSSAASLSCEGGAWWIMAALVRWHLVFLLVAFCHLHVAVGAASALAGRGRSRRTGKKPSERGSFWGLRSGERLALRLRTALGVLTLLCAAATAAGTELGDRGGGLFLGLHAHPAWEKCSATSGLDGSWGVVSPLLMFAVLAAAAGVYVRAGATARVRVGAAVGLVVALASIWMATGRAYAVLASAAAGMDWASWGIAGVLSCVCYQAPSTSVQLQRDSSGSAASVEDGVGGGGGGGGGGGWGGREQQQHHHRSGGDGTAIVGARWRSGDARRAGGGGRWAAPRRRSELEGRL